MDLSAHLYKLQYSRTTAHRDSVLKFCERKNDMLLKEYVTVCRAQSLSLLPVQKT